MIMRAKISAVRDGGAYSRAALINFFPQMRRLFEGGAYSSKYGKPQRTFQSSFKLKSIKTIAKNFFLDIPEFCK